MYGIEDPRSRNTTVTAHTHRTKNSVAIGLPRRTKHRATALSAAAAGGIDSSRSIGGRYSLRSCSVEGECSLFAVTGLDGAVRLYDWNALTHKHSPHHMIRGYSGHDTESEHRWLRARPPHGKTVSANYTQQQEYGGSSSVGGASSSMKSHSSYNPLATDGQKNVSLSFHAVS